MSKSEFAILVKGMKAVYTHQNFLADGDSIKIWYEFLKDLDYQVCQVAIQKHIMTNKFPPSVAEIREMCAKVMIGDKPLWSDGWEEVIMAIRRYGSYDELKAIESMSDITKQCVRRLGYQNLCRSEDISIERANFRMIYEQIANREHEKAKLPSGMRQLISQIQNERRGLCDNKNSLITTDKDS